MTGSLFWKGGDDLGSTFLSSFYTTAGWSLVPGLHPCSAAPCLCPCHGLLVDRVYFPALDMELGHMSFFDQHFRRHYMSKDLNMLRWWVWFSRARVYSEMNLPWENTDPRKMRDTWSCPEIKASPAEPSLGQQSSGWSIDICTRSNAYSWMSLHFRMIFPQHYCGIAHWYRQDRPVHVESLIKEMEGLLKQSIDKH